MLRRILIYFALLIASFYMGIAYLEASPTIMVAILLMLPPVIIVVTLLQKMAVKIKTEQLPEAVVAGDTVPVCFRIKNSGLLPVISGRVRLKFHYSQAKESSRVDVPFSVPPFTAESFRAEIYPDCCGVLRVTAEHAGIFDPLGLFFAKLKFVKESHDIRVLPKLLDINTIDRSAHINTGIIPEENADVFGKETVQRRYYEDRPGDDPGEIFRTREYVPGDALSHANWKMTARTGKVMIKDYSMPVIDTTAIVIDICCDSQAEFSAMLTTAASLAQAAVNTGNSLIIEYFDAEPRRLHIESSDDIAEGMSKLLNIKSAPYDPEILFDGLNASAGFRQICFISSRYKLIPGQEQALAGMTGYVFFTGKPDEKAGSGTVMIDCEDVAGSLKDFVFTIR